MKHQMHIHDWYVRELGVLKDAFDREFISWAQYEDDKASLRKEYLKKLEGSENEKQ